MINLKTKLDNMESLKMLYSITFSIKRFNIFQFCHNFYSKYIHNFIHSSQFRVIKTFITLNIFISIFKKVIIFIRIQLCLLQITSTTKKCHKRSKCKTKVKTTEIAPSTYVTFPAIVCRSCSMVQAPEGPVVATNVVPNTCNPTWKQKFDVALPVDLLKTVCVQ